jgi:transposase
MQIQETVNKPKLYIGVDIHKKSWSVTIRTDIMEHKNYSMPPNAEDLFQYVEKNFPNHDITLTYEAGCCGFSAARFFLNLGWNLCVVNPADVPTMHKQNFQKTDKIDSRNLCKQLQMGNLNPIHVPQEEQEQFRSLLRCRMTIAKDLRSIKNQIKSALLFHGIKIPDQYDNSHWTNGFVDWIGKIEWSNVCGKSSMARKLETYQFIKKQYLDVGTELRAYSKKNHQKNYELLKSIPGIGGFTAAAFLAEIGDFSRFNNEAVFSSFIGVVPGIFNSGSSETNLGVTPRANHILRTLLVESVWVAVSKDPEIQAYYKSHIGKNAKAIVIKIAHKMARRIFAIIKTQIPYQINKNLVLDTKMKLPQEANEIIIAHEAD